MSDGKVVIDIELDASGAKAEAGSAGKAAGKEFSDGVDKGASGASSAIEAETSKAKGPAESDGAAAGRAFGEAFEDKATSALDGLGSKIAGAIGIGAAISGALSTVEVANDFQEDMGKLTVAFESVGHSAGTAKATYQGFVGILGETDQSVEAANHLAELTDSEAELSQWTDIAAGVYAKFGDSLPIEGLTEAANETAKVGQVTGPLADALNWAGISEDKFNEALAACNSEQERATLITETLNDIYAETGRQYQETNADIIAYRESQSNLNAAMSETGRAVMPVVSALQNLASHALGLLASVLPPIIGFFEQWWPVLLGVTVAAGAFFIAINMGTIVSTVTGLLGSLKTAILGVNAAMKANPAALVVSLVAGVIAAIAAFLATNEEARAKITEVWEGIKATAGAVWGAIVTFFTETIPNAIQSLVQWFTTLDDRIREKFQSIIAGAASFVASFAQKAVEAGQKFFSGIIAKLSEIPGNVINVGRNIVEGIWNGISAGWGWLVGKLSGFANNLISKVKEFFGIHSPSTVFRDEIGVNLSRGIVVGYEKGDPVKQIEASLSRSMSSLSISAAVQASGAGGVVNHFTIERIDAHDMQGIDNVNALIGLFQRNAYA